MVNPDNPFVARAQISCAAHELPLTHGDDRYFGDALDDAVRELVLDDLLKPRGDRMFWAGREPPAARVGLRSGSSLEFQLVDTDGRLVGTVDASRAFHVRASGRDLPAPGASVPRDASSTPSTTSPCSNPPTTPTSSPNPGKRPTSPIIGSEQTVARRGR